MIYDSVKNIAQYSALNADLESVVRAALDYAGERFSTGHVAVDGERVYLNLASYHTHDASSAAAEAHKAYIDIMVSRSLHKLHLAVERGAENWF